MSTLIRRMIQHNPDYGSTDENGAIYQGHVRCVLVEAMFWKYHGKKLPGRAAKQIRRAETRYLKDDERLQKAD